MKNEEYKLSDVNLALIMILLVIGTVLVFLIFYQISIYDIRDEQKRASPFDKYYCFKEDGFDRIVIYINDKGEIKR